MLRLLIALLLALPSGAPNLSAQALEEIVRGYERGIQTLPYEVALVIEPRDGALLARYTATAGDAVKVPIWWGDAIITHNHPGGDANLSLLDYEAAIFLNAVQLRVVTRDDSRCAMMRGDRANWNNAVPKSWAAFEAQMRTDINRYGAQTAFAAYLKPLGHAYRCGRA